jgi:hypothetical protein
MIQTISTRIFWLPLAVATVLFVFANVAMAQNSGNPLVDCSVPQVHATVTHTIVQTNPLLYETHIDAHWTILPAAAQFCVQVKAAPFGTGAQPTIVLDTTVTDTLISFTKYHLQNVALNVRVTPCSGGSTAERMLVASGKSGYASVATPNGGLVIIDVVGRSSGTTACIGSCTLGAANTLGSCSIIANISAKAEGTNPDAYALTFNVYNTAGTLVCTRSYTSRAGSSCYAQLAADVAGSCFSGFTSPVCFTSSAYSVKY